MMQPTGKPKVSSSQSCLRDDEVELLCSQLLNIPRTQLQCDKCRCQRRFTEDDDDEGGDDDRRKKKKRQIGERRQHNNHNTLCCSPVDTIKNHCQEIVRRSFGVIKDNEDQYWSCKTTGWREFLPAFWEPCTCEQPLQEGKRCHIRNGTPVLCIQTRRDCKAYPCGASLSSQGGSNRSSTMEPRRPTRPPPRTRRPRPDTTITTDHALVTTPNEKYVTTWGKTVSPTAVEEDKIITLGAALGGVTLVAIISIIILILTCRKSKRNDRENKEYCDLSACCVRSNDEMQNPMYMPPEMTHHSSRPEAGSASYGGTSVRTTAAHHVYETIKSVRPRIDQSDSPEVNASDPPSGLQISAGDATNNTAVHHEYLELESEYDQLNRHRPGNDVPNHFVDHPPRPFGVSENGYDVINVHNQTDIGSGSVYIDSDLESPTPDHAENNITGETAPTAPLEREVNGQPYATLKSDRLAISSS